MKLIHIHEPEHTLENSLKKAKSILDYKPDIVVFEYPKNSFNVELFNEFESGNKPQDKIIDWKKNMSEKIKIYPWIKGDLKIIDNIEKLWSGGKQVFLFNMDGPIELTSLSELIVASQNRFYFDVWNFLREQFMIKTLKKVIKKHPNYKIIVLCHDSHWSNLEFLLKENNKNEIMSYYFGAFDKSKILWKLGDGSKIASKLQKFLMADK